MIPLGQLLTTGHPPMHPVCMEPALTWQDLREATNRLQDRLPESSAAPWLLAVDSAFHFVAGLLACWQKGIPVMISPDTQPGTLDQMRAHVGGCLTDRMMEWNDVPVLHVMDKSSETPRARREAVERQAHEVAVELFTSGSTGQRKRIAKTFSQLDQELASWECVWPGETPAPVLATVSHFHIYGLLFQLLRPLSQGAPFHDRNYFFWEELLPRLPDGPAIIVSSPVHLRHLPQAVRQMTRNWSRTRLLCSGGPLPEEVAAEIVSCCGKGAVEIYGSTETGGVSFRQQTENGRVPWQPLPGVGFLVEKGLLAVRSGWLADEGWHLTSDKAEPEGTGGFHLLGRADQIVKILEKRVSLVEMDARLAEHPYVSAARTLPLPREHGTEREILGAVLELTAAGSRQLSGRGRNALENELKEHLRHHFDPITLPRRWRLVEKLPMDALGKVPFESLTRLFSMPAKPTLPVVLTRECNDKGCLLKFRVPEDLAYVEGHFPQVAVVPGVCQLKWVVEAIEEFCGKKRAVKLLEAVKYFELLHPGQEFNLEFSFNEETDKWTYRLFQDGGRKISSGRVQFAP